DGTIIKEPPTDFQVDSLEKLEFVPRAISNLRKIAEETDYELVMVTNQDGLGTDSFPEDTFWPAQYKMLKTLEEEGIIFAAIHVDRSFEYENAPTRKPRTGMLGKYLTGEYDLANPYVIGDRKTDVELAKNHGSKDIFIGKEDMEGVALTTTTWDEIYEILLLQARKAHGERNPSQTNIKNILDLD